MSKFRRESYACLTARGDELFELAEAVLCTDGPVKTLVDLALAPEHRRGHGALYDGLNHGRIEVGRLRTTLARQPLPRAADERLVLATDISPWLRPDAATSPDRSFCHTYGRGQYQHVMIPGWPYSIVAALETGRTSWTALLDAIRLEPGADVAAVTAAQLRDVVERLIQAGQHHLSEPDILIVVDAGYDVPRLAFLLADLPVEVLGRMRSDRVLRRATPSREEFFLANPGGGRPSKHGTEFVFGDPATWQEPQARTVTATTRYGSAIATAWDRLHPRLTRRSAWDDYPGDLPIIEGTVIRLQVEHLPSGGNPKPVWLWWSKVDATCGDVDRLWQAFLRRFDLEHTFRLLKQTLGWTTPKIRAPQAADIWTWLILAVHTQLRLARGLVQDLRRPWEKPADPDRLTPARVRRGFRNIRTKTALPAHAPKPSAPGRGRPPGSRNKPVPRHEVGRVLATGEVFKRPAHHRIGTKPRRRA
ncbi:NF041680 family putative transposase [Nonomuraea candida]|uniref:NF041680 family putative transposase n=1 Tax=Nonomuraea candida TaxID=359159 RepID=UPI001FE1E9BF|nr:NF041680 family putative transposase [Nonomuraea candida]